MDLFEQPKILRFEKVAVPLTKMTGAVDRWPEVILQALVQQVPYIANYELSVHVTKVDASQGYGFGFIAAKVPTERSLQEQAGPRPVPYLRVPVIIKDWQLLPFDLFMRENTVYPLTQKRVEEALHSTEMFDIAAKAPPDASIAKDMYPPSHGTAGMGTGGGPGALKQAAFRRAGFLAAKDAIKNPWVLGTAGGGGVAANKDVREAVEKKLEKKLERELQKKAAGLRMTPETAAAAKRVKARQKGRAPLKQRTPIPGWRPGLTQKKAFLCESLANAFVNPADKTKLANALDDEAVAWHVDRHAPVRYLLGALSNPEAQEKLASADPLGEIEPTVVQIARKADGGFVMKAASAHAFRPIIEHVSSERARNVAGEDVMKMASGKAITVVRDPLVTDDPFEKTATIVNEPGMWSVWDPSGQRTKLAGVFTRVMDLDGTVLGTKMAHVIAGGYCLQQKIAGAAQISANIEDTYAHSAQMRGRGFLVDPKTASATIPFTVTGMGDIEGRTEVYVRSDLGKTASLEIVKGIHSPTKLAEDRFAVPSHFRFCPVGEKMAKVGDNPRTIEKRANLARNYVEVVGDSSGQYTLRGPQLLDFGPMSHKQVKEADALFLLGAMGVEPGYALKKLAWCQRHGPVTFRPIRPITMAGEVGGRIKEALAQVGTMFPDLFATRVCLVKEALEIDDPDTVDKILGLNFLRPENVQMYIGYLPELEEAVTKLGDILFAARVGLSPVSEDAVRRSLFALEETVQQLKILAQTGLNAEAPQVA